MYKQRVHGFDKKGKKSPIFVTHEIKNNDKKCIWHSLKHFDLLSDYELE